MGKNKACLRDFEKNKDNIINDIKFNEITKNIIEFGKILDIYE